MRNLEQQLTEYAKLANLELIQEIVETKANGFEVKRLHADFELHLGDFSDLKSKFSNTVDSQVKLQNNTKEFSAQMDHKFKMIDDEMKRNSVDYMNKVKQVRD